MQLEKCKQTSTFPLSPIICTCSLIFKTIKSDLISNRYFVSACHHPYKSFAFFQRSFIVQFEIINTHSISMREYLYSDLILSSKEIRKLVNTDISVETNCKDTRRGYLKTIDPVSHTLVLQMKTRNDKRINIQLIPSHVIRKVISHDQKIEELDRKSFEQFILKKLQLTSMDVIKETKEKIVKQLEKNKFPCKLDALDRSIIVGDICKIKAPYREADIECANYKVAKNLKTILKDVFLNDDLNKL